jgi:hypothetical protein
LQVRRLLRSKPTFDPAREVSADLVGLTYNCGPAIGMVLTATFVPGCVKTPEEVVSAQQTKPGSGPRARCAQIDPI